MSEVEKMEDKVRVDEEVVQVSNEELEAVEKEVLEDDGIVDAEIVEEEEDKPAPPPPPLIEQLKVHTANFADSNKTILGYSILFADEAKQEEASENEVGESSPESTDQEGRSKRSEATHGMATTYPAILNQILLGYHTNLISNEEVGFIEIIAHSIANRLAEMKSSKKDTDEVEIIKEDGKAEEV